MIFVYDRCMHVAAKWRIFLFSVITARLASAKLLHTRLRERNFERTKLALFRINVKFEPCRHIIMMVNSSSARLPLFNNTLTF